MVDYDSSCALVHAMEVWNQKSLLLTEYGYQTTIDLDSIVWLVALLYGITKNIFLAQGIANSIIILVYVYVIDRLFRKINVSDVVRILGMICYFIPYTLGQLGYTPMIFTAGAFYTVRALIPLLLISILLEIRDEAKWNKYILRLVYLLIMIYFAGLSSGVYVLLCGVLPLLVAEVVHAIIDDDFKKVFNLKSGVVMLTLISGFAGVFSEKIFGLSTKASQMVLVSKANWINNVFAYFVGIFELFGGVATTEDVLLSSSQGIITLINWAIISIALVSIIYTVIKSIVAKKIEQVDLYCLAIFVVNFFVLTLLFTTYGGGTFEFRYHLIPMLPIFILMSRMINDIVLGRNKTFGRFALIIYSLIIMASLFASDFVMRDGIKNSTSFVFEALKNEIEENEYDNVIFVGNSNISKGRIMRAFVPDVNCIILDDDWRNYSATSWGGTSKGLDNLRITGKTAIICSQEIWDTLPAYLKKDVALYRADVDYVIYETQKSYFDMIAGYPKTKRKAKDFPYTLGYGYLNADINEKGYLVSNGIGGQILYGPFSEGVDGTWNVTIKYNILSSANKDDKATFAVSMNGGQDVLGSAELPSNKKKMTIKGVELQDEYVGIEHVVSVPDGMVIEIKSITMEKTDKDGE